MEGLGHRTGMGFFRLVCVWGSAQGGESGNTERVQSGLDLEETLKSWEPHPGNHVRGDWREQSARDSLHAPQMPSSRTSGSHASQKASMALSKAPMSLSPFIITATYRALLVYKHSELGATWCLQGRH